MESQANINDKKEWSLNWVLPFLWMELSIAIGTVIGLAFINLNYIDDQAPFNLTVTTVLGLFPALILSVFSINQKITRISVFVLFSCLLLIFISTYISYHLGLGMIAI